MSSDDRNTSATSDRLIGSPWSVGVVIPARNEGGRVAECIASVRASLQLSVHAHRSHIVVVADHCHDDTIDVARAALGPDGTVLNLALGNVGAARRAGTARALRLLGRRRSSERTWLLTTDADSVVPPAWVDGHLRHALHGAAAVAGTIELRPDEPTPAELRRRFDQIYSVGTGGSHPHVHGANLGIRADAYLAVGGWESLATAEDHALWNRVRAAGWPTVAAADLRVTTSGRLTGRAPCGFAELLDELAHGRSPAVGPPRPAIAPVHAPSTPGDELTADVPDVASRVAS